MARSLVHVRKEVIVNEAKLPSWTRVVNGRKEEKRNREKEDTLMRGGAEGAGE